MRRAYRVRAEGRWGPRSAGRPRTRAARCSDRAGPETARAGSYSRRCWRWPGYARCYRRSFAARTFRWLRYRVLESYSSLELSDAGNFFDGALIHLRAERDGLLQHLELAHHAYQSHGAFGGAGVGRFK